MRQQYRIRLSLVAALAVLSPACASLDDSVLDNGSVRIGVDIHRGGAITYLSKSGSTYNVVNSCDLGRQIRQSYYSGPKCFQNGHWWKSPWPWNPIGTGDAHGNPSDVLEVANNGKMLYFRSIPRQWALDNVLGDCVFETWIVPQNADPNAIRVRCRLTNHRSDTNPRLSLSVRPRALLVRQCERCRLAHHRQDTGEPGRRGCASSLSAWDVECARLA